MRLGGVLRGLAVDRLPLLLVAAMVSLPMLDPHHRNPIPSFFAEWWAALLGLLAGLWLLLPRYRRPLGLPALALLPAGLALLIALQLAVHPAARVEMSLLALLYLLWVIYLLALGDLLAGVHGAARLADVLAGGLLAGALLSALVVALQAGGVIPAGGWISPPVGDRLYANLNQPNHLALQLWLGIAAAIHLGAGRRIDRRLAAAVVVVLVVASLPSGSRALWLYAFGLVGLTALLRRRLPDGAVRLGGALLALAAALIGQALLPQLTVAIGQRLADGITSGEGIRGGLWWMAVRMGLESPWLGIGWGHFSSAGFARIDHFRAIAPAGLELVPGEHAHNLGLHLLAELGLPALLLLLGCLIFWLRRVWRQPITPPAALGLALLLLLGLHAQVEYTLWYAYFLGIAALACCLAEPRRLLLPALRPRLVGLVLGGAIAALLMLRHDYTRLEQAMYWQRGVPRAWSEVIAELVELRKSSQFGRYVDLVMIGAMPLDRVALPDKLALCEQGIAFSPPAYAVFKCAALRALAGDAPRAGREFALALASYPGQAATVAAVLAPLTPPYPELAPLLAAARRAAIRPAN